MKKYTNFLLQYYLFFLIIFLVLIDRGMLAHRPSLDLLDGLDLDFLTANYGLGSDMEMNMNINSTRENNGNRNSVDIDPRKGEINRNQNQKDDIFCFKRIIFIFKFKQKFVIV